MKLRKNRRKLTAWQKSALSEMKEISARQQGDVVVLGDPVHDEFGLVRFRISVNTEELKPVARGLPVRDTEEFTIAVWPSPLVPPSVEVGHLRFFGFPHVLQGQRICVYLDPSREWDARGGIRSLLNRLWSWLSDAVNGRFDSRTALYHAVGGVLHASEGAATVVVRQPIRLGFMVQHGYLSQRTRHRFDFHSQKQDESWEHVPVVSLQVDLPLGAGKARLKSLVGRLDDPYLDRYFNLTPRTLPQAAGFLTALAASASRKMDGSPQHVILAVPHPMSGTAHLLVARIPAEGADKIRKVVRDRDTPLIELESQPVLSEIPMEWCKVSDERDVVTTRRDTGRPVNGFNGKRVHILGCGGIGSWIAEFIARAGASRIDLCDPGSITGGLLVRQNYTEDDIGETKAAALARRLRAIRDDLVVEVHSGLLPADLRSLVRKADLLLDATVNRMIGQVLDEFASSTVARRVVLAQVATDARSGTIGILNVSSRTSIDGPNAIDLDAGKAVLSNPRLEAFHALWKDPNEGDEVIPTRGCSAPTFHGSAADLAAVSASLVSLLGGHMNSEVSGTHLIALPHSGVSPHHHFEMAR